MSNKPEDSNLTQFARGAALALANAEDLFREAAVLFACKAFSRALFLHQISMEECGKIEILGALACSHLLGLPTNARKVESALASHKAKNFANAYLLPVGDAEQKAREESDWNAAIASFKEQQAAFHQRANARKNSALYVDFVDGVFHAPHDRITEEMCHEIAGRNAEFIALIRLKVEMLGQWATAPKVTRQTLDFFCKRIEGV